MATRMVQRYYSLLRYSGTCQIFTPRQSFPNICKGNCNIISHCVRQCPNYGSKAGNSRPTQDGHIIVPVDRLKISYSRSSGAGGQHVNKVSTKAEVRFHIYTADWISDDVKQNIVLKNKNRINKAGELLVTSELTRSQHRNLEDCIQKISDIITEASEKPREPSEEDIALRASRLERRNQERLKEKKFNSATKQSRRVDFD